jgi:hypothetical protein
LISTNPSTTSIKANPAEVLQRSDDLKRETPVSGSDLGGVVYQLWWASIVKIVVHICHAFFSKIVLTELRANHCGLLKTPTVECIRKLLSDYFMEHFMALLNRVLTTRLIFHGSILSVIFTTLSQIFIH